MILYDGVGPNPHVVRLFAHERGARFDVHAVDTVRREHRKPPFSTTINTKCELPAFVCDNGTVITETTAIMEYLDEIVEGPSLIGATPEDRAVTRRWTRRVFLGVCAPSSEYWLGSPAAEEMYAGRRILIPEGRRSFRMILEQNLDLLERDMEDREFIASDRYSMADCMLLGFLDPAVRDWGQWLLSPARPNIGRWYERMLERPTTRLARNPFSTGRFNAAS